MVPCRLSCGHAYMARASGARDVLIRKSDISAALAVEATAPYPVRAEYAYAHVSYVHVARCRVMRVTVGMFVEAARTQPPRSWGARGWVPNEHSEGDHRP